MDVIKQTVQVEDEASTVIERIQAAWEAYNSTVAAGVAPAEALDAAYAGMMATQQGLLSPLSEVTTLMSSLGVEAGSTSGALDAAASSADSAGAAAAALSEGTSAATNTTQQLGTAQTTTSAATKELSVNHFELRDALQAVNGGMGGVLDLASRLAPEVAGAAAAFLLFTNAINEQANAFEDDQVAAVRLDVMLKANVASYGQYTNIINATIASSKALGFTDEESTNALARMTPFLKNVNLELRALADAQDLARISGNDLTSVSLAMARAMETGQMRMLKQYGIDLAAGSTAVEILDAVEAKYAGSATAYAGTVAGAHDIAAASYQKLEATGGAAQASFRTDLDRGTAKLYDNLAASGAWGASLGTVIEKTSTIWGTVLNLGDMVTGGWLDQGLKMQKSTEDTNTAISGSMGTLSSVVEEHMAAAQESANTHSQGILDAMIFTDKSAAAGSADGQAFKDYLDAKLALTVALAGGRADEIIAAMATAQAAIDAVMASLGAANAAVGIFDAAKRAQYAPTDRSYIPGTPAEQAAANADVGGSDALKRSQYAPTVYPVAGYDESGKQTTDKNAVWTTLDGNQGPAEKKWGADQKSGASAAKKDASAAKSADNAAKAADKTAEAAAKALSQAQQTATAELQAIADKNALAAATDLVTAAQNKLTADTATATATMKAQDAEMTDLKAKDVAATAGAAFALKNVQDALDSLKATHKAALDAMTEEVYQYNIALTQTKAEEDALIAPLQTVADAAQKALDAINTATQKQDNAYTHLKETLTDAAAAADANAKQVMGPLNDAYDAATAHVQALTDEYANKLFPIEQKLQALQNQAAASTRATQIGDEAQSVGNLTARMANLVVGSVEYNALLKQRNEAQAELNRNEQIDSLTTQKDSITAERDKALKAAQEQVKVAQQARDAEQKLVDAQKANNDARMAALVLEQTLYDRQQRDAAQAATDAKTNADKNLLDAQTIATAKEKIISDEIIAVQARETAYTHDAAIQEAAGQTLVDQATVYAGEVRTAYTQMEGDLTTRTNDIKAYLEGIATVDKANVASAQADSKTLSDSINARKDAAALAKATADDMAAYGDSVGTANDKLTAMTPILQAVAPAMTAAGNAVKNDLVPAIKNLPTDVVTPLDDLSATFLDYIGIPSQSRDLTKNIPWAIDGHNKKGFIASINQSFLFGLGIDGLKGTTIKMMDDWKLTFEGYLTAEEAVAKLTARPIGTSIVDGITAGVSDLVANSSLQAAVKKAVNDAIAAGKLAAESGSPSEKAAREIGVPISQGVGVGVARGTSYAKDAMSRMLDDVLGVPYGAGNVAAGVPYGGSMGGGTVINNHVNANVTVSLPNVTDTRRVSSDPNDYKGVAIAIEQAIAYETGRRGIPRPVARSRG